MHKSKDKEAKWCWGEDIEWVPDGEYKDASYMVVHAGLAYAIAMKLGDNVAQASIPDIMYSDLMHREVCMEKIYEALNDSDS
jgi:hypothetical protein